VEEAVIAPPAEKAEEEETLNPIVILAAERETTITSRTDGSSKVWRINSTTLNNEKGAFDIGIDFNVLDDEFIFSKSDLTKKANYDSYSCPPTFDYDFKWDSSSILINDEVKSYLTATAANELVGSNV